MHRHHYGQSRRLRRQLAPLLATLAPLVTGGCQSSDLFRTHQPSGAIVQDGYVATNEPAQLGREQLARGNYGLSERYFRQAVEARPADVDAWIGLGASYDHLKRFDLADRAYGQALELSGSTAALLNNQGYSFLLRGDFIRARIALKRALELEPGSEVIINNLKLLVDVEGTTTTSF